MNFLKRAWCYTTRRITKSILLIVTFFVIGNFVILGLGVSQAADNAKILTRQSMKAVVNYEVDYDAYYEYVNTLTDQDEINQAWNHYPTISEDVANQLAQDERVTAYNYMINNIFYSHEFDNVPVGNENENSNSNSVYVDEFGVEHAYVEPNINVYANAYPTMIEMTDGTYTIVDGRFYTQQDIDQESNVCLITQELAEQNNFRVGDSITISPADSSGIEQLVNGGFSEDTYNITMEIIGIYNTTQNVDPSSDQYQWMSPWQSPKNIVLMPLTTYANFMEGYYRANFDITAQAGEEYMQDVDIEANITSSLTPQKVVYLLDDPLHVDEFVSDHSNSLQDYTKLNANNETFQKLARPLDSISFFASIIVWIVVVNAVIIISLVTALTLKTREYEIGVLLSIGVSKFKVVLQLFAELFLLAIIGFTLAVGSGSLLAGQVGDMVLDYQQSSDAQYTDDTDDGTYYFSDTTDYFTEVSQDDLLSQYHVSVNPLLILEIYLLGTGVVFIAIVIPSFMIMRLNPKQILMATN